MNAVRGITRTAECLDLSENKLLKVFLKKMLSKCREQSSVVRTQNSRKNTLSLVLVQQFFKGCRSWLCQISSQTIRPYTALLLQLPLSLPWITNPEQWDVWNMRPKWPQLKTFLLTPTYVLHACVQVYNKNIKENRFIQKTENIAYPNAPRLLEVMQI